MRKPALVLFIVFAFVTISTTGCDVLWGIGRAVVAEKLAPSDTAASPSGAFYLKSYPWNPYPLEDVHFCLSASSNDAPFSWDFGDGSSLHTSLQVLTHEYTKAGTYTVTVSGFGISNQTKTATETVFVRERSE